jgi:hypothetical protein
MILFCVAPGVAIAAGVASLAITVLAVPGFCLRRLVGSSGVDPKQQVDDGLVRALCQAL